MGNERAGGFFVELEVKQNETSFKNATNNVNKLESGVKKLVGVMKAAAVVKFADAIGKTAQEAVKASAAIGISATQIDRWSSAVGAAGINAKGLTSSMAQLENKMQHFKMGQVDTGMAVNLGRLGIGYGNFSNMNADQRMKSVMGAASQMKDQRQAAALVGDILGSSAKEYYEYLRASGKSLSQQLAEARKLTFTNDASHKAAAAFKGELNQVTGALKSIGQLIGEKIMGNLTPLISKIKEIIMANRELIVSGVTDFAQAMAKAVEGLVVGVGKIMPLISKIVNALGGLNKILRMVALGFASVKIANFAKGIMDSVRGVNLLQSGLKGLGLGAIMLLLDDLYVYFSGSGKSITGLVMDNLDSLKGKFSKMADEWGITSLIEAFQKFGTAVGDMIKSFTKSDTVGEGLQKIAVGIGKFAISQVKELTEVLKGLLNVVVGLCTANWDQAKEGLSQMASGTNGIMQNFGDVIGAAISGRSVDEQKAVREKVKAAQQAIKAENSWGIPKQFSSYSPETQNKIKAAGWGNLSWEYQLAVKNAPRIEDGIVRPDGHITQVAPDDWVIAAKDLGNVAAAFMPTGYAQQAAGSTAVINQTFNVSGSRDLPQTIRQQAYKGTSEALQNSLAAGQNRLQLLPGLA